MDSGQPELWAPSPCRTWNGPMEPTDRCGRTGLPGAQRAISSRSPPFPGADRQPSVPPSVPPLLSFPLLPHPPSALEIAASPIPTRAMPRSSGRAAAPTRYCGTEQAAGRARGGRPGRRRRGGAAPAGRAGPGAWRRGGGGARGSAGPHLSPSAPLPPLPRAAPRPAPTDPRGSANRRPPSPATPTNERRERVPAQRRRPRGRAHRASRDPARPAARGGTRRAAPNEKSQRVPLQPIGGRADPRLRLPRGERGLGSEPAAPPPRPVRWPRSGCDVAVLGSCGTDVTENSSEGACGNRMLFLH